MDADAVYLFFKEVLHRYSQHFAKLVVEAQFPDFVKADVVFVGLNSLVELGEKFLNLIRWLKFLNNLIKRQKSLAI